ncbi:transcription factor TFIIIB component-like protein [Cladorrhinum sp. PSN332]|nr:transcription factor TFIIIB component-like protein [Cladorrhinum sp. PSN332]
MLKSSKVTVGPKVKAKAKAAPRRAAPDSKPQSAATTPAPTSTPNTPYFKEDTPAESQPSPPPPPPSQGAATPAPEPEPERESETTPTQAEEEQRLTPAVVISNTELETSTPSEKPTSTTPVLSETPAPQVQAKKAALQQKKVPKAPPKKPGAKASSSKQTTTTEDSDPTAISNTSSTPPPVTSAVIGSSSSAAPAVEDSDPFAIRTTSSTSVSAPPAPRTDAPAISRRRALPDRPAATPTAEDDTNIQASIEEPTGEAAESSVAGPSRASRPRQPRKRKADAAADTAGDEASGETSAVPAPKKRAYRKRAAPLPGEEGHVPAAPRARRGQKRKAASQDDDAEAAAPQEPEENGEDERQQDGERERGATRKLSTRSSRSVRETTPEDAENMQIDVTEVKMADLIKDMHIGKKFSMHDELMARERAKRLKHKEKRKKTRGRDSAAGDDEAAPAAGEGGQGQQQEGGATSASASASTPAAEPEPARNNVAGEVYQIINGEIVIDSSSLALNVHQRAQDAAGSLETIVENEFTHHITSQTYLRRALKPGQWDDGLTNEFYRALSRFGTDFETISKMFPGMTRKHIKLKFNREERANPARIQSALVGEQKDLIDIEEYKTRAVASAPEGGEPIVFQPAEEIYAEEKRREEEFEASQKAIEDAKAEEDRKKKEELLASLEAAKQKESGGRKKKNKKNKTK